MRSNNKLLFNDSVYHEISIDSEILQEITSNKYIQRLKKIHQNGIDYLVDSRRNASRFDHSLGVMWLVKKLGGNLDEQISGLLHDISHTAFSHVIDNVFSNEEQNYHDAIRNNFLKKTNLETVFTNHHLDFAKTMKENNFSIVKCSGSDLSADRLDYLFRDLLGVILMSEREIYDILENLIFHNHRIKCLSIDTARLIFEKFLLLNTDVFFKPLSEIAALVFCWILKKMLVENLLKEEDFFLTDDIIINKIKDSAYSSIFAEIHPEIQFKECAHKTNYFTNRKLRFVDPVVLPENKKLTELCSASRKKLQNYLGTKKMSFYDIPLLTNK